jgi:hypothetical protein
MPDTGFKVARQDAERYGTLEVPPHLRNAPTELMQDLGSSQPKMGTGPGPFEAAQKKQPIGLICNSTHDRLYLGKVIVLLQVATLIDCRRPGEAAIPFISSQECRRHV